MAKNFKSLTDSEKQLLKELIAKKKAKTLTDDEAKKLAELNERCGFKGGKSNSKEGFKPGNDFSWWNKRPELLKDAANYKCNYVAGTDIGDSYQFAVSGVMTVDLIDTFGICSKQTDPLNVWARDLYLKMFQKYRVANGYSQSDLGITLMATVMLFGIVAFYERIYGIINRYSVLNVNMPFTETRALGISDETANWLRSHLSDFRYDLNELIARAQRICLPNDISLVADKISLYGYEYLDHQSARSQIIMFRPKYYATFQDTQLTTGGALRFDRINYNDDASIFNRDTEASTNMCVILEEMLNSLLGSDSVVKMYADLVTWFGEGAMLHLLPLPENYIVVPTYSESILHKIHNLESWYIGDIEGVDEQYHTMTSAAPEGAADADRNKLLSGYYVYQFNDVIISKPVISNTGQPHEKKVGNWYYSVSQGTAESPCVQEHLLDTYHEEVTEETVTEGVLFKYTLEAVTDPNNGDAMPIKTCAFEIATACRLWNVNPDRDLAFYCTCSDDEYINFAGQMAIIDWAPLSYWMDGTLSGEVYGVYGDVDNIVMIPNTGLNKLHRAIIYSGLNTDIQVIK